MRPGHRASASRGRPLTWVGRLRAACVVSDGFALPVALIAIMVIGALVTGGFYASYRDGGERLVEALGERAFHVAEVGLEEALAAWSDGSLGRADSVLVPSGEGLIEGERPVSSYAIDIRSLGGGLYLISSTGRVHAAGRTVVRRVAAAVRTVEPALPASAALTVYGGLTLGDRARIDGTRGAGDDCGAAEDAAGVAAFEASMVSASAPGRIEGRPPIVADSTLDAALLSRFGDTPLEVLIAEATRVYEDGESESGMGPATSVDASGAVRCDASIRGNWGDPSGAGPCGDMLPVVLGVGDLHVASGSGQGILIVEGDLTMSGDFAFHGVVVVKGRLRAAGTGNRVDGGVVVQGGGRLESGAATLAGSVIRYSPCRVDRAFEAALNQPVASGFPTAGTPSERAVGPGES